MNHPKFKIAHRSVPLEDASASRSLPAALSPVPSSFSSHVVSRVRVRPSLRHHALSHSCVQPASSISVGRRAWVTGLDVQSICQPPHAWACCTLRSRLHTYRPHSCSTVRAMPSTFASIVLLLSCLALPGQAAAPAATCTGVVVVVATKLKTYAPAQTYCSSKYPLSPVKSTVTVTSKVID